MISAIDVRRSFSGKGDPRLDILVRGNDIEKALRDLKRSLQKDGFFKEMRTRKYYEKPSVKKKRKQLEAERRRRKAMRNRRPERD
ncbi:MAG: 30S ribosomal protein S21 [Deltaproteobacteria bacterium]|nr:30S ribosomal protein S21 [Deltaproteobacteria bacterium]TLN05099.1 MAG: 30S ribosomal protein S21 [bacterium]